MIKGILNNSLRTAITLLSVIVVFLFLFSCGNSASENANTQKTATSKRNEIPQKESGLGDLKLEGENLAVTEFLNGDKIFEAKSALDWMNAGKEKKPAFCYTEQENVYGKKEILYNYYAISDARGLINKEKMLTRKEMEKWLDDWDEKKLSCFGECETSQRNYSGKFFDLNLINWWLVDDVVQSEEYGTQACVMGWDKNGSHASIQLASAANGFFIRCKK